MRLGILGGTFDPVHYGHLLLAEAAREQCRLDQVWFLPAAIPPHKQGHELSPVEQRIEMLELAVAGNPAIWWTVAGPIVNTIMLTSILGRAFQDKFMGVRPEYQKLMTETNSFLPIPKLKN